MSNRASLKVVRTVQWPCVLKATRLVEKINYRVHNSCIHHSSNNLDFRFINRLKIGLTLKHGRTHWRELTQRDLPPLHIDRFLCSDIVRYICFWKLSTTPPPCKFLRTPMIWDSNYFWVLLTAVSATQLLGRQSVKIRFDESLIKTL